VGPTKLLSLKWLITLNVITLSGFHSTYYYLTHFISLQIVKSSKITVKSNVGSKNDLKKTNLKSESDSKEVEPVSDSEDQSEHEEPESDSEEEKKEKSKFVGRPFNPGKRTDFSDSDESVVICSEDSSSRYYT
jgi:hypothetical protein